MKKSMKKSLGLILVLAVVASICAVMLTGCNKKVTNAAIVDETKIEMSTLKTYYFGTEGVADFGDATVSSSSADIAKVEGSKVTVLKEGDFKITINGTEYTAKAVTGVNVSTEAEMNKANGTKVPMMLHKDLVLTKEGTTVTMTLQSSFYGNNHTIDCEAMRDNADLFTINSAVSQTETPYVIRDLHVVGQKVDKKAEGAVLTADGGYSLSNLEKHRTTLIAINGGVDVTLDHVFLENGFKLVLVQRNAKVKVANSILRNCADTLLSIGTFKVDLTKGEKGPQVEVENNIMANAVVAAICMFQHDSGFTKNDTNQDYFVNLNIKGFFDVYNWKEMKTAVLMPSTEDLASIVNGMVGSSMKSDKYSKYFYKSGEDKFIHCAMIILSTAKNENKAVVNGLDGINFKDRSFPLPAMATSIAKTCKILGYGNNDDKIDIKPTDTYNSKHVESIGFKLVKEEK